MCVSACGQPVASGPFLGREQTPIYTIGAAFGASDCVSEVRADVFDEPAENSADDLTIDDWHRSIKAGMKGWTIEQVETFVQGLAHEFGEKASVYAETLKREDVNGEVLLDLNEDDLKDLGFSLGHRRKLLACIQRSS